MYQWIVCCAGMLTWDAFCYEVLGGMHPDVPGAASLKVLLPQTVGTTVSDSAFADYVSRRTRYVHQRCWVDAGCLCAESSIAVVIAW
jgi:hypothetical protein